MKEIYPNLHIGSQADYENIVRHQDGWYIIHACKDPYHRQTLGYTGKSAPKEHPEYLIAYRDNHLILNLVDAPDPAYIPKEIIDEAINVISINIVNQKVFVHCNQGQSRSAVIGLLYLHHIGVIDAEVFEEGEKEFLHLYPWYSPENGMRMFAKQHWDSY